MYIAKYQHFSHSVLKAETCNMIVRIANRDLDQTTATEKSDIGHGGMNDISNVKVHLKTRIENVKY